MRQSTYHFFINLIRLIRGICSAAENYVKSRMEEDHPSTGPKN